MEPGEAELVGYTDRLSVAAGERLTCMVHSPQPFAAQLVRLRHGDTNPAGPGHRDVAVASELDGSYPAQLQTTRAGSYAVSPPLPALGGPRAALSVCAWIRPTKLGHPRPQAVIATGPGPDGFALGVEPDGRVALRLGPEGDAPALVTQTVLLERHWYFVAAVLGDDGEASLRVVPPPSIPGAAPETVRGSAPPRGGGEAARPGVLVVGASPLDEATDELVVADHFNGKIEAPALFARALTDAELDRAAESGPAALSPLLAWDFGAGAQDVRTVVDAGPGGYHGRLVNLPTRAVTGRSWTGAEHDFRHAPEQYAAIHFHDDDLEDAGWDPSLAWTVPEGLASGVYAIRLSDADGAEDLVPFTVKPKRGEAAHAVGYLLPTNTYLAYANERLLMEATDAGAGMAAGDLSAIEADRAERLVARHPEWGSSTYDRHSDGSGCCHSTRLRPIPNMRPGYRYWSTGAPERFASDLYIVDWLWEKGIGHDTFTDEDLHHEGAERLAQYRVVLTGTHPEYWTGRMLAALEAYLAGGGRVMYLGGNGFYWVTSIPEDAPHTVEIRRGVVGTRPWTSEPGETVSSTGEPGGLWRYRGRDPNRLAGVGFSAFALADPGNPASGYARCEDSFREEMRFVFEGIGSDEVIGDFGLICDGAAGYEIDRFDHAHGTPPHALRLATSRGRHDDTYLLVIEDLEHSQPGLGGTQNELVGADLAFVHHPNGGAVFSVGSCNWGGSLSHASYDNNVSRITENVLRAFATDEPLPGAPGAA